MFNIHATLGCDKNFVAAKKEDNSLADINLSAMEKKKTIVINIAKHFRK